MNIISQFNQFLKKNFIFYLKNYFNDFNYYTIIILLVFLIILILSMI